MTETNIPTHSKQLNATQKHKIIINTHTHTHTNATTISKHKKNDDQDGNNKKTIKQLRRQNQLQRKTPNTVKAIETRQNQEQTTAETNAQPTKTHSKTTSPRTSKKPPPATPQF